MSAESEHHNAQSENFKTFSNLDYGAYFFTILYETHFFMDLCVKVGTIIQILKFFEFFTLSIMVFTLNDISTMKFTEARPNSHGGGIELLFEHESSLLSPLVGQTK